MSTMQSGDVPEILRSHLPKYGALIDTYVDDLGDAKPLTKTQLMMRT